MKRLLAGMLAASLALSGCRNTVEIKAPPRVDTAPLIEADMSTLKAPLTVSLDQLQGALERRVPRELWSIDERRKDCVPAQRIRPLGVNIRVSPDISCRIRGNVTRGRLRLEGRGQDLLIRLPVKAVLRAEDVGGILKGETADGSADATLRARLSVTPDWRLRAKVDVDYRWSREPGIDFLGQRIELTRQADDKLRGLVGQIERELEAELGRISMRPFVANAWKQGFTVVRLSADDPPAWLRITPQQAGVTGYGFRQRQLAVDIAVKARTETFIGPEPEASAATPLPQMDGRIGGDGFNVSMPVLASYSELEPVVLRELREVNARGIVIPGVGKITAEFEKVEVYATEGGRIAVGIWAKATPGEGVASRYGSAEGVVWLTGVPANDPDSAVVRIENFALTGESDRESANLLARLFMDEEMRARIEQSLVADFSKDYDRVVADARTALRSLSADGVTFSASVDEVHHGQIQVTGQGLLLPVTASGRGSLSATIR